MSSRLEALRRQVAVLRRQFLPDPFDPLGNYPDGDLTQAHARAFLVLSHAEVESYLEEWAKDIARAAERVWTGSQRVAPALGFLLAASEERVAAVESLTTKPGQDSHFRMDTAVKAVLQKYYRRIKENNGIKERNVLSLFDPIGVPASAYAPTLMPNLDALGSKRGEHAHYSSRAVALTSVLDPETEHRRVQTVVGDLVSLDAWLTGYKRRIR